MNMKKLLILPIVGIVVSMLGVSVLAAGSASKGFTATDADGNDVSADYTITEISATAQDLTTIDGLSDKVKAVNSEADLANAELAAAYEVTSNGKRSSEQVTLAFTGVQQNTGDVFVTFHDGYDEYSVGTTPTITVDGCSPFYIYRITVKGSAPTGQYATPYIVMVSVALVACGAVFAVRAKKASK